MKDLIKKTETELVTFLIEKRKTLSSFRFAIAGSKTRNVKEGRGLRKDIARALTLLRLKKDILN